MPTKKKDSRLTKVGVSGYNEFLSKACPSFDVSKEYENIICFFSRQ
jgi:hypothetical protein